MKRTLMKDLAAAAGVSVSQVSRALGQKGEVAPELRQRIHELAREMNYRNCARNRPRTIAVLCGSFGEFSSGVLNGIERELLHQAWRNNRPGRNNRKGRRRDSGGMHRAYKLAIARLRRENIAVKPQLGRLDKQIRPPHDERFCRRGSAS